MNSSSRSYHHPQSTIPNPQFSLITCPSHLTLTTWRPVGQDSSVAIATGYGLDGPGIESRWGEIFRTCPDRPWSPPSHMYDGYRVFPQGKERPGRDADSSPPSSAVGHERAELYFYSPYGPYGLYRASVSIQGYTLPLPLPCLTLKYSTFSPQIMVTCLAEISEQGAYIYPYIALNNYICNQERCVYSAVRPES